MNVVGLRPWLGMLLFRFPVWDLRCQLLRRFETSNWNFNSCSFSSMNVFSHMYILPKRIKKRVNVAWNSHIVTYLWISGILGVRNCWCLIQHDFILCMTHVSWYQVLAKDLVLLPAHSAKCQICYLQLSCFSSKTLALFRKIHQEM